MRTSDYLLITVMALSFSSASVLVLLSRAPGPVAATWRLVFSSAILMAFSAATGRLRELSALRKRDLALLLLSGVFLAAHFDLWMTSLYFISVAVSVTLVDSYPAVLVVVGRLLFKESYSARELLGSLVAMAGVAMLSLLDPSARFLYGVILSIGGMISMVAYLSLGKAMRRMISTTSYTLVVYSSAAAVSGLVSLVGGFNMVRYGPASWAYLLALAVIPMMGGHTVMNYLIGRRNLIASTIAMMAEPVGSAALAYVIFGQVIRPEEAAFMAVTLLGIGVATTPRRP